MKKTVLAAVAILLAACSPKTSVLSPDGRIAVRFTVDADGVPSYAVDVDGKPFLAPSRLGLQAEGVNLESGFALKSSKVTAADETWHQPWGENKEVEDHHRELTSIPTSTCTARCGSRNSRTPIRR